MRLAAHALTIRQGAKLQVSVKPDASLVTEADLASERVILDRIHSHFPADQHYSEEAGLSSTDRRPGSHIWIVDPLDGTTNFANGYPFYCISIGRGRFRDDGTIEMLTGAVFDAPRGRLYYASLGEGAFVDGRRLQIAPPRAIAKCFLVTGFYYAKGEVLDREINRFSRVAATCQSIRRDGAAALDLALVAEGVFDSFWEFGLAPWDVAAGSLLVQEAGGCVRPYPGAPGTVPYHIESAGIIAGAPGAVEAIASVL